MSRSLEPRSRRAGWAARQPTAAPAPSRRDKDWWNGTLLIGAIVCLPILAVAILRLFYV